MSGSCPDHVCVVGEWARICILSASPGSRARRLRPEATREERHKHPGDEEAHEAGEDQPRDPRVLQVRGVTRVVTGVAAGEEPRPNGAHRVGELEEGEEREQREG